MPGILSSAYVQFSLELSAETKTSIFLPSKESPDGNWGHVSTSRRRIYVVLLSSKATATIPQQGRVRQLEHYIISLELFWNEKPEEKGKGSRMVGREKNHPKPHVSSIASLLDFQSGASQTLSDSILPESHRVGTVAQMKKLVRRIKGVLKFGICDLDRDRSRDPDTCPIFHYFSQPLCLREQSRFSHLTDLT